MSRTFGRRSIAAMSGTALCLVMLVGCGDDGSDGNDGAAGDTKVVVASPAPNSLFTFNEVIARELGFYDEEGIEVEVVALSDAVPGAALVQNGEVDTALIGATDALAAAAKAEDLRLPYDERTGGSEFIYGIVVPEETGIEDLRELEGENIGLASPDQDLALLAAALDMVDMTLDDVTTTVVGPGGPAVAESLSSGRIAAYTGTIQDFAAFGDAGLEVENIIPEGFEGLPIGGYVTTSEGLEANDNLVKFLRALAKGTYVALERPEIAEIVTQEVAPEQWREPEVAEFLLEGLYATLAPYGETFGEINSERYEFAQDLLIEVGVMESPADLETLLDSDFLEEINDWDREEVLATADAWLAENSGT